MRLIDADALVIMLGLKPDEWNTPDERWRPESEFGLWIINAPTIEPKRGRWKRQNDKDGKLYGWFICSECGAVCGETPNYCSECGARMEE